MQKSLIYYIQTLEYIVTKRLCDQRARLRAQSFTSLMVDLHQDIKHFLEGIAPLILWYINGNEKSNKYKYTLMR